MKTDAISPGSAFDLDTRAPVGHQDGRTTTPSAGGTGDCQSSVLGHPGQRWRNRLKELLAEVNAEPPPREDDPFPEASAQRRRLRDQLLVAVRARAKEEAQQGRMDAEAADVPTQPAAADPRTDLQPLEDMQLRARIAALTSEGLTAKLREQAAARKARRLKVVEDRRARGAARSARARERERFAPVSKEIRMATRAIKEAVHEMVDARRAWRKAKRVSAERARVAAAEAVREARVALEEARALKAAADARAGVKVGMEDLLPKVDPAAAGPITDVAWLEKQRAEFMELNAARMEKAAKAALAGLGKQDKERHVKVVIRKLRGRLAAAQRMRLALARSRLKAAEKANPPVTEEAMAILVAAVGRAEVAAREIPEDMLLATLADAEKEVRALVAQAGGAVKPAAPPVSLATENSGFSKARRRKAPRDPHARRAARAGMPKVPRIPRGQKEAEQVATPKDLREPPITAAAAGLLDGLLK